MKREMNFNAKDYGEQCEFSYVSPSCLVSCLYLPNICGHVLAMWKCVSDNNTIAMALYVLLVLDIIVPYRKIFLVALLKC